jgi:hypothetical protein
MIFRFNHTVSRLSDEELKKRVENRQKYLPETTEASIAELQQRGHVFSEEELSIIEQDIKAQRDNAAIGSRGSSALFNNQYKYNLVEDPDAPLLYSKRALYLFTVFCGALFGSIMLAINLSKIGSQKGAFWAVLFGIVFTTIQVIGLSYINAGSSMTIIFGIAAAYCIDYLLWPHLIGNSTFYRAKPIWIPLIIAVVLGSFILWATIVSAGQ